MAESSAARLHAATVAVATHRRDNPVSNPSSADAMLMGDKLDEAMETARHDFHRSGGSAEAADEITEKAFGSIERVGRRAPHLAMFHGARQQPYG